MNTRTNLGVRICTVENMCRLLCVALILLLSHNPYLGVPATAGALNVSHLPSYRATVAASELQHFTPSSTQHLAALKAGPLWKDLGPLQTDSRSSPVANSQVVSPPQQFLSADLWFRPPPVS